ncbi:uncharacterized protein PAC_09956 [Phialocephala subalpina]|uniref:Ecp2 effector protein domain-containing protein n=1 Tax=Phialocephala subalpina TaxID=576137 RepID=A0A1L7X4W3_9HELO|nr:uncharacterized protein PAC_09956 [Phialocephala subalpina]
MYFKTLLTASFLAINTTTNAAALLSKALTVRRPQKRLADAVQCVDPSNGVTTLPISTFARATEAFYNAFTNITIPEGFNTSAQINGFLNENGALCPLVRSIGNTRSFPGSGGPVIGFQEGYTIAPRDCLDATKVFLAETGTTCQVGDATIGGFVFNNNLGVVLTAYAALD